MNKKKFLSETVFFCHSVEKRLNIKENVIPSAQQELALFMSPRGQNKLCALAKIISNFIKNTPNKKHLN